MTLSESLTWQKKLGENKAEFSIFLCYELLVNEDSDFKIPNYIDSGIEWLLNKIEAKQEINNG